MPCNASLIRFLCCVHSTIKSRTLKLERELGQDGRTVFVKIHAPFETLCNVAEEINLVLPLKVYILCVCECEDVASYPTLAFNSRSIVSLLKGVGMFFIII